MGPLTPEPRVGSREIKYEEHRITNIHADDSRPEYIRIFGMNIGPG